MSAFHRMMSRCKLVGVIGVTVALISSTGIAGGALTAGSNQPAPVLALRDIDGNEVRLDSFRGRTVIVNFWATWCAPCVAEMPSLEKLRQALARERVEVLAVNLQENAARIRPFAERLGLTMPMLRDHDGSARTAWNVRVFPTTFVVGPDQRVALVAIGEIEWDRADVIKRIRDIARRPGATPASRHAALQLRA
ncbi:MAG TPA: TlpA disulfide reductase family protein [Casimicrobiaceae bacterium]|nr:TlpA disulfide reductase family protein [Casimicrobiaceae bacterium]